MADKNIIREGVTSVEVYRSRDAAPDNWDEAKFWLINELRRIQNGFFSVDEIINQLTTLSGEGGNQFIEQLIAALKEDGGFVGEGGEQGPEGPRGPQGPQGPAGPSGEGSGGDSKNWIADWKVALDTTWSSQKISDELNNATGSGGIGEAPQDGTPYSRQDASWVPAATAADVAYWLSGGIAISNSLDLMDGGDANSTPAPLSFQEGLLTIG